MRSTLSRALLVALVSLGAGGVASARQAASAPAAPSTKWVQVQSRSGEWTRTPAAEFRLESFAKLDAIAIRFESDEARGRAARAADAIELQLGAGEWIRARLVSAQGEGLRVELGAGAPLELSIDDVLSITAPGRLAGVEVSPAASGDRLYWLRPKGVDRVDGAFQEFADGGVVFESALGVKTFPWSEVGALVIEPLSAPAAVASAGARVEVDLAPAGRLRAELVSIDAGRVRLRWRAGRELELALDRVEQLVLDDGSVGHLGALAPARVVEGWPAGDDSGMRWPFQVDRSVVGGPLRAGGRVWPRGIGVHAPSRIEWELDGSWKRLLGSVAIDDSVELLAYRGSVRCAVYLDGAEAPIWRSGRIEGGGAPVPLGEIDLSGVRRVALEVDMDERLYVADRLNWLDLRLVR